MFKALLKKQLMEVNTWLLQDKKKGKNRSKSGIILLILLYVLLFGVVGGMFYVIGYSMCEPLCLAGLDWLYIAMMSLMAIMLGVFGSVFNTYTTLYEAKDNELLLSMPIKPSYILVVRILGVYLWSLIYTALAFVPAFIVYLIYGQFSISALICCILLLIVNSVFVLALSCVLGWVVAKISARIKNKSLITVIASLAFIVIYYIVYFKASEILQNFLANAATIGEKIKGSILPIYWLGKAGTGDFVSLLLISAIVAVIIAVILFVMSRSFIKMATTSRASLKRKYVGGKNKSKSADMALLGKEFRRFASSANYMLNCGLGCIMLPALGVVALLNTDSVREFIVMYGISNKIILMLICAAMCMLASLNDITSPSISLEGKNLWVVQSLPIHPWRILKAKLKLHLIITEIPVLICSVCLCIAVGLDILSTIICIVLPMIFTLLMAAFGLFLNLKMPNLTWTNEVIPIKQSAPVTIALFGGWVFVIALGVLYFVVCNFITEYLFLALCGVLILSFSAVLLAWLKTRGAKIFSSL